MRIESLAEAPTPLGGYMAIDDVNDGTKKVAFNVLTDNVLAAVGGRVPLLIELKGESGNTDLVPKVLEVLKEL